MRVGPEAREERRSEACFSGRACEAHREAGRGHSLKIDAFDVGALDPVNLEPHVDDRVGAVFLGFAGQGLDRRPAIGFGAQDRPRRATASQP